MKRFTLPRLCTLLLVAAAAPALAQSGVGEERPVLGTSYVNAQGRISDFVGNDGQLFPERTQPGVGVAAQPFVREDGTRGTRTGLVGSMPVAPGASVDVGLFSVNRITMRERNLGRLNPMRDVNDRGSKMAAVGLSLRF